MLSWSNNGLQTESHIPKFPVWCYKPKPVAYVIQGTIRVVKWSLSTYTYTYLCSIKLYIIFMLCNDYASKNNSWKSLGITFMESRWDVTVFLMSYSKW